MAQEGKIKVAKLREIVAFANEFLDVKKYKDYCPNGLQVEGRQEVKKIICAVTASQILIEQAIEKKADMILVHHGFFWRGEAAVITGLKKKRIKALLDANVNLVAYHLPLDGHRVIGNNAQLAKLLGLNVEGWFGAADPEICLSGAFDAPKSSAEFSALLQKKLARKPLRLGGERSKNISKVAICTGGAQNYFELAIEQGADAFVTGEVSEQTYHLAMESGVDFYSAGHHATERYGVQALAKVIADKFNLESEYIEAANPV